MASTNSKLWALVVASAVVLIGGISYTNYRDKADAEAAVKANAAKTVARIKEEAEQARQDCRTRLDAMNAEYGRLLDAKNFAAAATAFGNCPALLHDDRIAAMSRGAARLDAIAKVEDKRASVSDRLTAIRKLREVGTPEDIKAAEPLQTKLLAEQTAAATAAAAAAEKAAAQASKRAEAADLARRKKEGVSIGMTKADVVRSSWGRPQRVNTTTNVYGTHEQWVYPGGYLYFEGDVLTSIQN